MRYSAMATVAELTRHRIDARARPTSHVAPRYRRRKSPDERDCMCRVCAAGACSDNNDNGGGNASNVTQDFAVGATSMTFIDESRPTALTDR